jgi:hypothetical protein
MKTLKHSIAIACAVTLLAGAVVDARAGHRAEREDRKTVAVKAETGVFIVNPRGRAVVIGSPDATEVTIVATRVAKARSVKDAEALLEKIEWKVYEKDGQVIVKTIREGDSGDRSLWSVIRGDRAMAWVDYAIEVPRRLDVRIATTSGEARIHSVDGLARVHATSGDIEVRDIGGGVEVELTSGTVEARDIRGDMKLVASSGSADVDGIDGSVEVTATSGSLALYRVGGNTTVTLVSGDLTVRGCLGDVVFVTQSGDAEIHDVEGSISAMTSSGDLDVVIVPVGEKEFNLSSSSGDIDVRYRAPDNYGFKLNVNTNSGSIEGDMAIKVDKITRRQLRGIVGSGKSRVVIETASGDVKISEKNGGEKHDHGDLKKKKEKKD